MNAASSFIKISIITLAIITAACLDLKAHGINKSYYISDISIFRNRAFLSIPRSSCFNNVTNPTLIEVKWNHDQQNLLLLKRRFSYPNENSQNWGKCQHIQSAISLEVEAKKARLWVLDEGTKRCKPKLIIYNLILNIEVYKIELEGVSGGSLKFLVVDSYKAYIPNPEKKEIIVFSFEKKRFSILKTEIAVNRLVFSKTNPILYATNAYNSEIFTTSSTDINFIKPNKTCKFNFHGNLLGAFGGIASDAIGGLNYYLTRDHVVLRWHEDKPLIAEYHDVLLQSYDLMPYVSQLLISGPQDALWALVNPFQPKECNSIAERKQFQLEEVPNLQKRVVKLAKFNKKGLKSNLSFVKGIRK